MKSFAISLHLSLGLMCTYPRSMASWPTLFTLPPSLFPSPQTYIGSILCAVNPYKPIENVYSLEMMQSYQDRQIGERPPHIFAISNELEHRICSSSQLSNVKCVCVQLEKAFGPKHTAYLLICCVPALINTIVILSFLSMLRCVMLSK